MADVTNDFDLLGFAGVLLIAWLRRLPSPLVWPRRDSGTACGAGLVLAAVLFASTALALGADEAPVYPGLKPDQFMKRWLVLKCLPVTGQKKDLPDEAALRRAFAKDNLFDADKTQPHDGMKQQVGDQELAWRLVKLENDIVDLKAGSKATDFAIAYAWAEIDMPEPAKGVLGVGSDDAVKVWLNGKLVHEHWVGRSCRIDDDVVPVAFVRGKNRLLLKVQNFIREWGFCCRLMSEPSQAQKLITAVRENPDPDALGQLLDQGLDVNSRNAFGLTAIQAARLRGDMELVEFLAGRGADAKAKPPSPERLTDGSSKACSTLKALGPRCGWPATGGHCSKKAMAWLTSNITCRSRPKPGSALARSPSNSPRRPS